MKTSRRDLLAKGGALALVLGSKPVFAQSTSGDCVSGFDYATYSINGQPIHMAADEHALAVHNYSAKSYAVGGSSVETRSLLTVDVGSDPGAGVYHPVESGGFAQVNTITDIYVFNSADNGLLFWKKFGSTETAAAAMFVMNAALAGSSAMVTVVARCALHGYWGMDFNLSTAPEDYKNAVVAHDASKVCAGVPLTRPYLAVDATGGQGDLTILHRSNIIKVADDQVKVFLGGDLDGTNRHPRFATNHYIMGGVLFDQNGNLLALPQSIRYSDAGDQEVLFTGLKLTADSVTTLRAVMFDCLQGRMMGFLDLA